MNDITGHQHILEWLEAINNGNHGTMTLIPTIAMYKSNTLIMGTE
jgi:hypothetical protein